MPTDFSANYPDLSTLRTSLSFGGEGEFPGTEPIDMEALLAQAYRWKQRSADADAYRRGKEAQLSAERQAAALRLNAATQGQQEDRARTLASRDQLAAGNTYAEHLENLASPINYRFTPVTTAAKVMGLESPARLAAMAAGRGSSEYRGPMYGPEAEPDPFAADFRAQTRNSGYGRG